MQYQRPQATPPVAVHVAKGPQPDQEGVRAVRGVRIGCTLGLLFWVSLAATLICLFG